MNKNTLLCTALLAALPMQITAQDLKDSTSQTSVGWSIGADGLFDRHQYNGDFIRQTISGMRINPEVSLKMGNNDRISAGLSWVNDLGITTNRKPDFSLYYSHKSGNSSITFGAFPRTILQRQLPSSMLYDSIAFFNPVIEGALYQYGNDHFMAETYVNWLARKADNVRQSYRVASDGYWDADLFGYIDLGWYTAYTYYGTPTDSEGYYRYKKLMLNPYISAYIDQYYFLTDITAQLGLLTSPTRYEGLGHWVNPMGINLKIDADWRLVHLSTELYAGDKLLPYMLHNGTGMAFHRSDPFYNNFVYSKNRISLLVFKNDYAESNIEYQLHCTTGSPLSHQLLFKIHVYVDGK